MQWNYLPKKSSHGLNWATTTVDVDTYGTGKRGHIVADWQMFPRLPARATFVADTNFVSGTQNMFPADFVQKHFVSAANVSQFAQPKKHHEQLCVLNNVSSFASTLKQTGIRVYFPRSWKVTVGEKKFIYTNSLSVLLISEGMIQTRYKMLCQLSLVCDFHCIKISKCVNGKLFTYLNLTCEIQVFLYLPMQLVIITIFHGNKTYGMYCLEIMQGTGKLPFKLSKLLGFFEPL